MLQINSGKFHDYRDHHMRWFEFYRADRAFEIWFGDFWIWVEW